MQTKVRRTVSRNAVSILLKNLHEDYRRTAVRDGRVICECREIKHVSTQTNPFDCSGIVGILLWTVKLSMRPILMRWIAHNRLLGQEIK
jgi:hypothetical protein